MKEALDLSLGEAEALVAKAARGAGLPWGLAIEAGRALRRALIAGRTDAPTLFLVWLSGGDQGADCPLRRGLFTAETGSGEAPPAPDADALVFAAAADRLPPAAEAPRRCRMEPRTLTRLDALAARTYAPATEESRRRGAG